MLPVPVGNAHATMLDCHGDCREARTESTVPPFAVEARCRPATEAVVWCPAIGRSTLMLL